MFVALIASSTLFVCTTPVSAAMTAGPGWSITSTAQPTNFSAADAEVRVESLTVTATGGEYELSVYNGITGENNETAPIQWNASAEELQRTLEEVPEIGSGNVRVSGGPGDATGSHPYTIEWPGKFAGRGADAYSNGHTSNLVGTLSETTVHTAKVNDQYIVTATNTGSRATKGEVTITDTLPDGLVPVTMEVKEPRSGFSEQCAVTVPLMCAYNGEPIRPGGQLRVTLRVLAPSSLTGTVTNAASVSGGGGAEAKTSETNAVNAGPAPFGIHQLAFEAANIAGGLDMQAGDHPYGVTTRIELNTVRSSYSVNLVAYAPSREVKDVAVELPLGFVGDPFAAERCPEVDMTDIEGNGTACPPGSRVGTVVYVREGGGIVAEPELYNLVPEHGFPAELGFTALGQAVIMYASVVPGTGGYRLRLATPGVPRGEVEDIAVTVFGDPAEHNGTSGAAAFVANPTRCSDEPLSVRAEVTAWEGGSDVKEATAYPSIAGCNLLTGSTSFSPSFEVQPETTQADTPSGYEVDLKVPQAPNLFGALATSDLKDATVTLPADVSVSPSAASGPNALEGCTEAQIDLLGTEIGEGHPGGNGSPYDDGLTHASPGHCPEGSRIGEVEVKTPVLEEALHGHVFLAEPHCGQAGEAPCTEAEAEEGKVFGLYMEMAGSGVIIKLAGSVEVGGYGGHNDLAPGQLRANFDENPQFPFEDLTMTFSGGQRAPLANPQSCGTFTTTSELEPWSGPESGTNATPSWPFTVTGCSGSMGFAPSFGAGTVQTLAGAFSPFTMSLTRNDGEQDLAGVSVTMPPGVAGLISKVPLCGEAQANAGTCPESSRIGTAHVAAGAGSEPLWLEGRVYLTTGYKGAPFGLSIVVPAVAGPYNLGDEVVRAAISINPTNAQVTVASNPIPLLHDGVPVRIKAIDVTVDRPEFTFNPTNCSQLSVTGTASGELPDGASGSTVPVSAPFAVTGCKNLPFAPKFSASTLGQTSKADGASLKVNLASAGLGQASIAKVDLTIPKILPSRLTTLQKACTEAQFNANPAGCPAASDIATAIVHTPILSSPLTGPAYFVSRGGAAFPDVEMVLQGEGVTLILDGHTQIKNGVTYSRFESVPDAPFTTFEFNAPKGPYSIFGATLPVGADSSLCGESLTMPTTITGQNGAVITQSTKIAVTGCKAAIRAVKQKRSGGKVLLTLRSTVAGTLTVSGRGVKKTKEKLAAGEHQVKIALTKGGRHRKQLKLKIALKSGTSTLTKAVTLSRR